MFISRSALCSAYCLLLTAFYLDMIENRFVMHDAAGLRMRHQEQVKLTERRVADCLDGRKRRQLSRSLEHQREAVCGDGVSGRDFGVGRWFVGSRAQQRQTHHLSARVGRLEYAADVGVEGRAREHVGRLLLRFDWDLEAKTSSLGSSLPKGQQVGAQGHTRGNRR